VVSNVESASAIFGTYVANTVNVNDQATVNLNIGVVNVNNAAEQYWISIANIPSSVGSATGNDYSVVYNVQSYAGGSQK
jgi:hypothetical protein